ncbi:MAG: SH3 domain-containing protein [Thermodesulfobacteriota bacterium]
MNHNFFSGLRSLFTACLRTPLPAILTTAFLLTGALPLSAADTEFIGKSRTVKVDVGNLFSRPFETASVMDTLQAGDRVTLLAKEGDWYMVKLPDQRLGWVHQRLFTEPEPPPASTDKPAPSPPSEPADPEEILPRLALRVDKGWVREAPSSQAEAKFALNKGDIVSVVDTMEGWYYIRLEDGRNGWAYQDLFRPVEDTTQVSVPEPVQIPSPEESTPSDSESPLFEARLKVDSGRVRTLPTTNSGVKFGLQKGDTVSVMDRRDGWYFIQTGNGETGWAYHTLFYPPPEGTSAAVSGESESEAEPVTDSEEPPVTAGEPLFRARVKVDSGRVREAPTTESQIKFGIQKGDTVSVEDTRDGWYFIRLDGGPFGWAHQSLFSLDAAGESEIKKIESIRFEDGPAGEEKIIFSLNGFYPPKTFALDEEVPKVVCDFINTRLGPNLGNSITVGGDLVQKIRIGYHESPEEKVRVVIDLSPDKKYSVEQVFYKKTNLYTLTFKNLGTPVE